MNILFTTDENYAKYLVVSIYSILKHNDQRENIHFYIAHHHLSATLQQQIEQLIHKHQHYQFHRVTFIPINIELFKSFPLTIDYISAMTYVRLAIENIQELQKIDKLIYLDIDILVNGDLSELWNTNLHNKTIGACFDQYIEYEQMGYKKQIGLSKHQTYFNAGVLLIDMKKWKQKSIFTNAIQWVKQYQDIIQYQDQDILNGLLKNDVHIINNRFNCMPATISIANKQRHITCPVIIYHYCGLDKPWHEKSKCFKSNQYIKLAKAAGITLHKIHWLQKIKYNIKTIHQNIKYYFKYKVY